MKYTLVITLAFAMFFLPLQSAHAYLDPGTGSIILQALLGGIAGGILVIKIYWTRVKKYFLGLPRIFIAENREKITLDSANDKQTKVNENEEGD